MRAPRSSSTQSPTAYASISGNAVTVRLGGPADVEAALYDEIDKVKTGPIAEWEIEKAHNNARRQQVAAITSSLQRAIQLGENALFYDDPNLINTRADRIQKITAADVRRVAQKYLTTENRSVVITLPKPGAGRGGQR